MSLPKYEPSKQIYDVSVPRERVIKQNCNIPAGYRRLSCYFPNTAENGIYLKKSEEGSKIIALGGPLTENTIVGNTETEFSIAIGTGDDKKGGAGFMAIEKLDSDGMLPEGFPLRDFFNITDNPSVAGTQKIINDEGAVLYVAKFEDNPTKGQFVVKTAGIDSEGTLNVLNPVPPGQPAIYSTDISNSYETDAYIFIASTQYGDTAPGEYGTPGIAGTFVTATSKESNAYTTIDSATQKVAGDGNALTSISSTGSGVDANVNVTIKAITDSTEHSLQMAVDSGGAKSLAYYHAATAVYGLPTDNTPPGADRMLITDGNSVLQFSTIQDVMNLVPSIGPDRVLTTDSSGIAEFSTIQGVIDLVPSIGANKILTTDASGNAEFSTIQEVMDLVPSIGADKILITDASGNVEFSGIQGVMDLVPFIGADKILTTDGGGSAEFVTLQDLLSNVLAFADDAAASGGGIAVGETYYNTTNNVYTRRQV